jgi:hypothetical protein
VDDHHLGEDLAALRLDGPDALGRELDGVLVAAGGVERLAPELLDDAEVITLSKDTGLVILPMRR